MTHVERTPAGLRIHHACPAPIEALTTVRRADGRWYVLSAAGRRVRCWDVEAGPGDGLELDEIDPGPHPQVLVVTRPGDGTELVVARDRGNEVWRADLATGAALPARMRSPWLASTGPTVPPVVTVPAPDGGVLVLAMRDGTLRRWDPVRGEPVGDPWTGYAERVWAMASLELSDGTPVVVSGGPGESLRRWDPATGRQVGPEIEGYGQPVRIVPVRWPDGRAVVCVAGGDGVLRMCDVATGERVGVPLETGWRPSRYGRVCEALVATVPTGGHDTVVSSYPRRGAIQRWNPVTGEPIGPPVTGPAGGSAVALAGAVLPDGRPVLVVGDGGGNVTRFDAVSGEPVGDVLRPHGAHAWHGLVADLSDGRRVVAVNSHDVHLFDARSGEPVGDPYRPRPGFVYDMALARRRDGGVLLVGANDSGVARLDPGTGVRLGEPEGRKAHPIRGVATVALPDGRTIVAGAGYDSLVYRWDAATGEEIGEPLAGHRICVTAVTAARGPGGSPIIVSGCEAGRVLRWDAVSGEPVGGPLPGDVGMVTGLGVLDLPGGRQMLVGVDFAGGLHRWDPATGLRLGPCVEIPECAALLTPHVDAQGVPTCWFLVVDDETGPRFERWRLDTGTLVAREDGMWFCGTFNDGDRTIVVRSHPDGSLTIEPLPPVPEELYRQDVLPIDVGPRR